MIQGEGARESWWIQGYSKKVGAFDLVFGMPTCQYFSHVTNKLQYTY